MKKEVFKRLRVDSQERDLSCVIDRDKSIPLDTGKIISITGVRRRGKMHLLFSVSNKLRQSTDPKNIVYINFEDDRPFPLSGA